MKLKHVLLIASTLLSVNCSQNHFSNTPDVDDPITATHFLTRHETCDEWMTDVQEQAIAEMESRVDSYYNCRTLEYDGEDTGVMTSADSSSESGATFTGTNIQETNVDESDIIKTNGEYIFVATSSGVDVFKAWPLSEFSHVTTYNFEDGVDEMFLVGDELVTLQLVYDSASYVYNTTITILNVNDPLQPMTEKTRTVQGNLVSARAIDDVVHVVVTTNLQYHLNYPSYDTELSQASCNGTLTTAQEAEIETWKSETKAAFRAEIEATDFSELLPQIGDGTTTETVSCSDVLTDNSSSENSLSGLFSMKINADEEQVTFIKGDAQEVYASTNSVYFTSSRSADDETDIHRFALNYQGGLHHYVDSGTVAGHLLDQFSMSEYNDTLRVATTVGHVSHSTDNVVYSNVFVLNPYGEHLPILGQITNIASGEQIYAARFVGNRGYLVTFEKVDPLFIVDLSDSQNPELTGELVMPGYSAYLHPLDENHIIGFGKDAEDAGNFSWYQGLKLGVFDVSDATAPVTDDDLIIGSRGSDSTALYDHRAFTFDNTTHLVALPLALYTGGTGGSDYGDFQYNGVHVYSLADPENITTEAIVELPEDSSEPERTLFLSDDNSRGLFILDNAHLYLYDLDASRIAATKDLN